MALQSSGSISLNDIQTEFGGSNPISLSEYYQNASPDLVTPNNTNVPNTGNPIALDDFYSAALANSVTYEIIGGGGEGAGGYTGQGNGSAGTDSSLASSSGTSFTTVTSTGGAGGTQPAPYSGSFRVGEAGEASYYGSGGAGGLNSDSGNQTPGYSAPATSYGAGGGGGGAAPFSANNGGGGGKAATRQTGTLLLVPGSVITVTIGTGGNAISGGGNGAGGYAKLTVGGTDTEFTSSGTYTVPS